MSQISIIQNWLMMFITPVPHSNALILRLEEILILITLEAKKCATVITEHAHSIIQSIISIQQIVIPKIAISHLQPHLLWTLPLMLITEF